MRDDSNTYWNTVIQPGKSSFCSGFMDLWNSRYLIWLLIKRDLTVQYKQTVLGFAWYFVSPVITMLTYMLVFGKIAGIATDNIPQPLFYLSGICLWEYFSTTLTCCSTTLQTNSCLFSKVYFPRLVPSISQMVSKLFRFSLQLVVLLFVYCIYLIRGVDLHPNLYILTFPLLVVVMQGHAMGLGLIISSLSVKYRDLRNFFGVFVSLWMYATPIVYPLSHVTNPFLYRIMFLNPLTAITEAFKFGLMGVGDFSWSEIGYSVMVMLVLLLIGVLLFNKKQESYIDTI